MIEVRTGNLLESKAQTLVNTVNCVGVMGKGIALEFKQRFPEMFKDYADRCARGEVRLGHPYLYRQLIGPWVLNFPTKDHWRSLARLDDIVNGLEHLADHYQEWNITSIAVPPLGCGNGQLEWRVVGPTLYRHLRKLAIPVELYAPEGTPIAELQTSYLQGAEPVSGSRTKAADPEWIKPGWIALVEIVKRLDEQPFHWPIGRTVFQKIAYVATVLGIPTELEFDRGSYGPYAAGLKRLESRLIGNGLLTETPDGQRLRIEVGQTYDDAVHAYRDDLPQWNERIDRIVDLFMRISTAGQAELVATVLFATRELASHAASVTERDVFEAVLEWKSRRSPPLDQGELGETIRGLAAQQWINIAPSDDLPAVDDRLALV